MNFRWSKIVLMVALSLMTATACGNDSMTEGDRKAFTRWCGDADLGHCTLNLQIAEGYVEEGWSADCAIQFRKDELLGKNPDPYRCE
jgi:hypothetical protein